MLWSWKFGKFYVKMFNSLTADFYADLIKKLTEPLNWWVTTLDISLRILALSSASGTSIPLNISFIRIYSSISNNFSNPSWPALDSMYFLTLLAKSSYSKFYSGQKQKFKESRVNRYLRVSSSLVSTILWQSKSLNCV